MALLHCDFFSDVLGMASSMDVILPGDDLTLPAPQDGPGSSVLYLLHGHSDDHSIWQRRTSIERYVAGLDLAVIMPNVHRSFYADMAAGLPYWTFVSEELPWLVQRLFHISSARENTFVAGLSMGGYGAFKLALRQPQRFAAAASLSGVLDIVPHQEMQDFMISPTMRLAFGEPGAVRDTADDLLFLVEGLAASKVAPPLFYQCCGTADFLYEDNVRFRDFARTHNLPLTYEEGPGGHDWAYWDQQIQRVLAWLPLAGRDDQGEPADGHTD